MTRRATLRAPGSGDEWRLLRGNRFRVLDDLRRALRHRAQAIEIENDHDLPVDDHDMLRAQPAQGPVDVHQRQPEVVGRLKVGRLTRPRRRNRS